MRTRDRLHELHKRSAVAGLAGDAGAAGEVESGAEPLPLPLLPAASAAAGAGAGVLDELLEEVERVRCWVRDLEHNTALARALHADPAFHASKHLQEQLDVAVTESNALALKVSGALRQMQAGAGTGAARRARTLQSRCWWRLYAEALRRHHAALSALRDDRLLLLRQQVNLTNPALTDEECESLLDADNVALFVDNVSVHEALSAAANPALTNEEYESLLDADNVALFVDNVSVHEALSAAANPALTNEECESLLDADNVALFVDNVCVHEALSAAANPALTDEECESLLDADNVPLFVDNVRAETAAARLALRDVEARRDELLRVESGLRDLHQLFLQLAHLVAAQQEQVDTVEYYALAAGEWVQSGGRQLLQGSASKARARKKKISLVLCVAVGCLVVLLVLVLT